MPLVRKMSAKRAQNEHENLYFCGLRLILSFRSMEKCLWDFYKIRMLFGDF